MYTFYIVFVVLLFSKIEILIICICPGHMEVPAMSHVNWKLSIFTAKLDLVTLSSYWRVVWIHHGLYAHCTHVRFTKFTTSV